MIEKVGNIWDYYGRHGFVVVITTNGVVKSNGDAVMGKGVALEAKKRTPGIAKELGSMLKRWGNRTMLLQQGKIFTFPTKHDWRAKSNLLLIFESASALKVQASTCFRDTYVMPRPGCGCGGLKWEDVRPLLIDLPDNVWVLHQ